MPRNWPVFAGASAVLAVPVALAVIDDARRPPVVAAAEERWELLPATDDPVAATAVVPEWPPGKHDSPLLERLFFAGAGTDMPALTGPFAPLRFGMTRPQVEAAVPGLGGWEDGRDPWYPQTDLSLEFDGPESTLSGITVGFPLESGSLKIFADHWGSPAVSPNAHVWLNPATRTRAVLSAGSLDGHATLQIARYRPLAALFRSRELDFGARPLLGATRAELRRDYGGALIGGDDPHKLLLFLPASEFSAIALIVNLDLDDRSRVERVSLLVAEDLQPGARAQALALLREKIGPAETHLDAHGRTHHRFSGKPSIVAIESAPGDGEESSLLLEIHR